MVGPPRATTSWMLPDEQPDARDVPLDVAAHCRGGNRCAGTWARSARGGTAARPASRARRVASCRAVSDLPTEWARLHPLSPILRAARVLTALGVVVITRQIGGRDRQSLLF